MNFNWFVQIGLKKADKIRLPFTVVNETTTKVQRQIRGRISLTYGFTLIRTLRDVRCVILLDRTDAICSDHSSQV